MKLYLINLNCVSQTELAEWFDAMSDVRREEVLRLKVESKKASKIAADHLCRKAVSEFCGVSPDKIEFGKNEFGKPFAVGLNIHFSVSHSGELVVCAVSEKEIGIDVEKIREIRPDAAKKFACESELEYIAENENGFFDIWTLKEAYFKCIGTGLGADIKDVSFMKKGKDFVCSKEGFTFIRPEMPQGYTGSICQKD